MATLRLSPTLDHIIFQGDQASFVLKDGRVLTVPLTWFPRLAHATPEQRQRYEVDDEGVAIYWPELDEDISVLGLLGLPD